MRNESENTKQLRAQLGALRDGAAHAGYAYERLVRKMKQDAEDRINNFCRLFHSEDVRRLRELVAAKEILVRAAEDADAKAAEGKYPIGTRMQRWSSQVNGYGPTRIVRWRRVPEFGRYEVITSESVHPENKGSYARASIGDFVIRLERKNGEPGKQYVGAWDGNDWRPVGVDLDVERNAELVAAEQARQVALQNDRNALANNAMKALFGDQL